MKMTGIELQTKYLQSKSEHHRIKKLLGIFHLFGGHTVCPPPNPRNDVVCGMSVINEQHRLKYHTIFFHLKMLYIQHTSHLSSDSYKLPMIDL